MNQVTIYEVEKSLKENENKTVCLELHGMITANFEIHFVEMEIQEDKIVIKNKQVEEEKIEIERYQIMKIEQHKRKVFLLKFDAPQSILIYIK